MEVLELPNGTRSVPLLLLLLPPPPPPPPLLLLLLLLACSLTHSLTHSIVV